MEPGEFTILVIDANGCQQELAFTMLEPEELTVELLTSIEGDETIIELGEGVVLTVSASVPFVDLDSIVWTPPLAVECDTCQSNTVFPNGPTTYGVTVYQGECSAFDQLTIQVKKDLEIFVPNVFSPNGDGQNEVLFIQSKPDIVVNISSFLVFNRWGENVFEIYNLLPNDINYGWDGSQKGRPLDPQVFVWFAEVEFIDGSKEIYSGDVTLIK